MHDWFYPTRTFRTMVGKEDGSTGPNEDFAAPGMSGVGDWILGRNMFAPFHGPWQEDSWEGWWGHTPPHRVPTFVLTHRARDPVEMAGGTTFHYETGSILEAVTRAKEAARDKDVRIGVGTATNRRYLQAGLIDEMPLVVSPVLLGSVEHLLKDIDLVELDYRVTEHVMTEKASHVVMSKEPKD